MIDDPIDRRTFVKRAGVATIGTVALAGCGGDGDGGDSNGGDSGGDSGNGDGNGGGSTDFEDWMSNANNYDEVVDETGSDQVTVDVGVGSAGLGFDPAAVRVSTGTEVVWEWTGSGGQHNVVGENADFESDLTSDEGHTFSQTFEETGTIEYFCRPHEGVGMKGVVVVE